MVASQPFRKARMIRETVEERVPDQRGTDFMAMSVKQVREVIASMERPDPGILSRLARDPRVSVRRIAYGAMRRGRCLAANEDIFRTGGVQVVGGADEAGRGALAGPLAAAAVVFKPGVVVEGVNDSKMLAPEVRERLYEEINKYAECISVVFVDPGVIDRWGLQVANLKALADAVAGLRGRCHCVVCDHFHLKGCGVPSYGIPAADATFQSVAAASIVAKVERDRVMAALHDRCPYYNFAHNKGYGTEEHREALVLHGPSQFHRFSFQGVLPSEKEPALWDEAAHGG